MERKKRKRWVAKQLGKVWDKFYDSCEKQVQVGLDARLVKQKKLGDRTQRPTSAPLVDGLYELRYDQVRAIYYLGRGQSLIFVHLFIKKTREVPPGDIKLAKQRRKRIEEDHARIFDIPN